jgi:hypothetical protein
VVIVAGTEQYVHQGQNLVDSHYSQAIGQTSLTVDIGQGLQVPQSPTNNTSATGRKNRDPNFTQEQLDYLCNEVQKNNNNLFGKELSKEEKEILWEEIAERLNTLDPKGFRRTGFQVKRKYIKYQSELRNKQKQKDPSLVNNNVNRMMSLENQTATDGLTIQQDLNQNVQATHQMSFVDIIGVIPDVSGGQVLQEQQQMHELTDERGVVSQHVVTQLEPVNSANKRREEFMKEKIALQKIGLFMKMKKYQRMGHLNPTDVRLITRWIKAPSTMPFKSKAGSM